MKTIAVISQKGGAGKTTLALHIAVAAEQAGYSTVLVDMDPQGTAEAWSEWRKEAPPVVIPAKAPTLAKTLEKAAALGAELAVVDTPPLAEAEARAAMRIADLVLVPCRPERLRPSRDQADGRHGQLRGQARFCSVQRWASRSIPAVWRDSGLGRRDGNAGCPDPSVGTSDLPTLDR